MPTDNLVSIKNLTFKRGERIIFDDINMDIARGKITAVMGPSGTGKTTLLNLIGARLYPDHGSIIVDGQNIHDLSRKALYAARRKMGLLFQNGALFTNISTFENVAFPLREHTKLPEKSIHEIVISKLKAVDLENACDLMPNELSGGMARRAALARAIALDPPLIMYDEPFTGQDPIVKATIVRLIKKINTELNMTSILVTHDVAEALSIADYVYIISHGKVIGQGTTDEIRHHPSHQVNQFIQGLPE